MVGITKICLQCFVFYIIENNIKVKGSSSTYCKTCTALKYWDQLAIQSYMTFAISQIWMLSDLWSLKRAKLRG